jgi:tetratricopeptide (TPR) repeat protein
VARGCEALAGRRVARWLAAACLALAAVGAALVHTAGVALPVLGESHLIGTLRLHFGELEAARRFFEARLAQGRDAEVWSENLATVELADGEVARARELYASGLGRDAPPERWNGLAVASALAGDGAAALAALDEALARGAGGFALVNRGALLAARGELAGAESALRDALAREPGLVAGWHDLAEVLALSGRAEEAAGARERGRQEAARAPRGPRPYGLGENLGMHPTQRIGRRWLLWLEGGRLQLARPDARGPQPPAPGRNNRP